MQAVKWTTEGMRKGHQMQIRDRVFHDVRIRQLQGICWYPESACRNGMKQGGTAGVMNINPSLTEKQTVMDGFFVCINRKKEAFYEDQTHFG